MTSARRRNALLVDKSQAVAPSLGPAQKSTSSYVRVTPGEGLRGSQWSSAAPQALVPQLACAGGTDENLQPNDGDDETSGLSWPSGGETNRVSPSWCRKILRAGGGREKATQATRQARWIRNVPKV